MAQQRKGLLPRPEPSQGQSRTVPGSNPQQLHTAARLAGDSRGGAVRTVQTQALRIAQQRRMVAGTHRLRHNTRVSVVDGGGLDARHASPGRGRHV